MGWDCTAAFRERRTLDSFDFSFNPGIDRRQIHDLATGRFLDKNEDILLIGPPGVGKSHLAQAIGHELIKAGKIILYRFNLRPFGRPARRRPRPAP